MLNKNNTYIILCTSDSIRHTSNNYIVEYFISCGFSRWFGNPKICRGNHVYLNTLRYTLRLTHQFDLIND